MNRPIVENTLSELYRLLLETAAQAKALDGVFAPDEVRELTAFYNLVYLTTKRLLRSYAADHPELQALLEERLFNIDLEQFLENKQITTIRTGT